MNNNENSDNTLAIVIIIMMILGGLYFSPYWELTVKYAKDSIGIGLGFVITYAMYKTLKNRAYNEPELEYVSKGVNSIFLSSIFIGLLILPTLFYLLKVQKEFKINIDDITFYSLLGIGVIIFILTIKNVINMNKKENNTKVVAKPVQSFDLKPYKAINFDETKIIDIEKQDFPLYKIKKDKDGNLKVKLKDIPENKTLPDEFKIYEAEVFFRYIQNKDDMVMTIFEEDIYIEKSPIFIFDQEKSVKKVNPIIFNLIDNKLNKPKLTIIPYLDFINKIKENPDDEVLFVYSLLISKLYKNYKKAIGKKAVSIQEIFKKFDNVVEFVILELTYLCTINLTNFAIGQVYRYQKNNKQIKEILSAIDNTSFYQVKTTGVQLYMLYILFKQKKGYISSLIDIIDENKQLNDYLNQEIEKEQQEQQK